MLYPFYIKCRSGNFKVCRTKGINIGMVKHNNVDAFDSYGNCVLIRFDNFMQIIHYSYFMEKQLSNFRVSKLN